MKVPDVNFSRTVILAIMALTLILSGCVNNGENQNGNNIPDGDNESKSMDLVEKGEMNLDMRYYEEALEDFNEAIELYPDSYVAWNDRGFALYKLGQNDEAMIAYDKAISLNQSDVIPLENKANVLIELEKFDKALEVTEQALDLIQTGLLWDQKGFLLTRLKRNPEALEAYDRALEFNPTDGLFWNNKAAVLTDLRRYDEALEAYNIALNSDPVIDETEFYSTVYVSKGALLMEMNNYSAAVESFDKAIEIDPQYETPRVKREIALEYLTNSTRDNQ